MHSLRSKMKEMPKNASQDATAPNLWMETVPFVYASKKLAEIADVLREDPQEGVTIAFMSLVSQETLRGKI